MTRRDLGAWLVALPALLVFTFCAVILVVGFPVSLLLLPVLGPLMVLFGAQARTAQRLLRGAAEAAGTVVVLSFLAGLVATAGAVLASGVLRSGPPVRNEGSLWPFELGLIAVTAPTMVGGMLVFDRALISGTRVITVLAATVLAAGVVVLVFWPTAG
jgi:hypothetical protein